MVDPIARFLTATLGVELPANCGCEQRRGWLNARFPYKQNKGRMRTVGFLSYSDRAIIDDRKRRVPWSSPDLASDALEQEVIVGVSIR
ncbi:hypothetical protein RAS1_42370 [Phycisphaerae bacterium RAS1]|nr:hypothetical protein RAS1_42370 [Phycisphaerae bacterium RAS1]